MKNETVPSVGEMDAAVQVVKVNVQKQLNNRNNFIWWKMLAAPPSWYHSFYGLKMMSTGLGEAEIVKHDVNELRLVR